MPDDISLTEELESAISSGTAESRLKALTMVTDLFIAGSGRHTPSCIKLFDDVFLALVSTIEVNARVQLSRRLASLTDSPANTVRALAFDDAIAVAAPVLIHSIQLSDDDLIANTRTKSLNHLQAITQRRELSEPVTDALIACGDSRIVQLVVKNAGARFSETGFGTLVGKACNDEGLARFVGARRDIPRHHFLQLLENASVAARARIVACNPSLAEAVKTIVSDVAADIATEVRDTSRDHARAKARIKRLCRTGQFSEADIHAFAHAQNFESTAIALSTLGDFPIDLVERALLEQSPDLVLILAKAAQCCRSTARAVLLMRAADRGMSSMDMEKALAQYDRLQLTTARCALEFYRLRRRVDEETRVPPEVAMSWYIDTLPDRPEQASR